MAALLRGGSKPAGGSTSRSAQAREGDEAATSSPRIARNSADRGGLQCKLSHNLPSKLPAFNQASRSQIKPLRDTDQQRREVVEAIREHLELPLPPREAKLALEETLARIAVAFAERGEA